MVSPVRSHVSAVHMVRVAAAAMVLALAACTGPGPGPDPDPDPTLTLQPAATELVVIRGGSAALVVNITRTGGGSANVELSVAGMPAGVTASFTGASLAPGHTSSELLVTAPAALAESVSDVVITATLGELVAEETVSLVVDSLLVAGTVVGMAGQPLTGVAVSIQGVTQLSGVDGRFTIDGVSLPYDAALVVHEDDGVLNLHQGMMSAAPVFRPEFGLFSRSVSTAHGADVSGTLLGGAALAADEVVLVCVEGTDIAVYGCERLEVGLTSYVLDASWFGATSTDVTLHALHFRAGPGGEPLQYLGYHSADLTLQTGVAVPGVNLSWEPLGAVVVETSVSDPAGATMGTIAFFARFGPHLSMLIEAVPDQDGYVFRLMPVIEGVTYDVVTRLAAATPGMAWAAGASAVPPSIAHPTPPTLSTPADGTTGVGAQTPFVVASDAPVHLFSFAPVTAGPVVNVATTATSVTFPDVTLYGLVDPAGLSYNWEVYSASGTDADASSARGAQDLAGFALIALVAGAGGPGLESGDGYIRRSQDSVMFQFAP